LRFAFLVPSARSFLHPSKGLLEYTQVNFLHACPERYRLIMLLP